LIAVAGLKTGVYHPDNTPRRVDKAALLRSARVKTTLSKKICALRGRESSESGHAILVLENGFAIANRPFGERRNSMGNVIGAIFSGLCVGILARFFYPGAVDMGLIATILLGVAGSLGAGLVVSRGQREFKKGGLLASVLGGMALIFVGSLLGIG